MTGTDEGRFGVDLIRYVSRLRAFARTLTGETARGDDLAQEACVRAWRARHTFTPDTNMEAWLFRILRNLYISGLRRSRRMGVEEDLDRWRLASADDPSAGVSLNDLRRALNRLPHDQREALLLVGAGGWSYEEAAAYAECPLGTMKSRVFRARRALLAAVDEGRVLRDAVPASHAMGKLLRRVSSRRGRASRSLRSRSDDPRVRSRQARQPGGVLAPSAPGKRGGLPQARGLRELDGAAKAADQARPVQPPHQAVHMHGRQAQRVADLEVYWLIMMAEMPISASPKKCEQAPFSCHRQKTLYPSGYK